MILNGTKRRGDGDEPPKKRMRKGNDLLEKELKKSINPAMKPEEFTKAVDELNLNLKKNLDSIVTIIKKLIEENELAGHLITIRNFGIGLYLEELKKANDGNLEEILKEHKVKISVKQAWFLIGFAKLVKDYPKLIECRKPISWYKGKITNLRKICEAQKCYWKDEMDDVVCAVSSLFQVN
jgi:hypothetical protein